MCQLVNEKMLYVHTVLGYLIKRNGLQQHIRASHAIQILSQPTQLNHDTHQRSSLEEAFDTPFCNNDES